MLENWQDRCGKSASIAFQEIDRQEFADSLHKHSTYELTYIAQGSGRWQIGGQTGGFSTGSLLLVPAGVLHLFRSGTEGGESEEVSAIVLRFSANCLPQKVLELPEMSAIRALFDEARTALVFRVVDRDRLRTRLRSVHRVNGALRLARFYVALDLVSGFTRSQVAENEDVIDIVSPRFRARFEACRRFVEGRYSGALSRSEAARHLGMEEGAFSRFFKKACGTTFVDYVANLRVRHAARLLGSRRDLSVPRIAEMSGFQNLSAFHRQFKRRIGTTPNAYRKAANSEVLAP